ncbi:unnamed protein product [Rotaria socialis]|uniref:Chromo domain-containing protein n=1 Tax=Rotaria socialis TaxID=392032 RepID=A0A820EXM9_9BILA|nr:unnamed protein product [Rotaria socialis]CAF3345620.1 unnamed protein product [Rotaria socialis]CAF3397463.1 unnamed protein product [Rotaria socialis]CAF4254173.1 unnamed protein product [Rotaria socialis]CAF4430165.1 unnamed protein product [Rotaria socialis]
MSTSSSPPSTTRPNDYFDLPEEARADDQYVVEKVVAKRRNRKGKWEYLLKWAGFGDEDNTWEVQQDIHPDLIAEFERKKTELDAANAIYSALSEDPPIKTRTSSVSRAESPPAKKKRKTASTVDSTKPMTPTTKTTATTTTTTTVTATTNETPKKAFGVEKGWRVRAVIGAAKQKDSTVLYAVDYVQGSPSLREYVPSHIAHTHIPRELIEFFQKKIVWNSSKESKKT